MIIGLDHGYEMIKTINFIMTTVATIKDIQNLLPLEACGLIGVITGKALYSGTLDFKESLAVAHSNG